MSTGSFSAPEARALLERVLSARSASSSTDDAVAAAAELRASLQGLALLEGMPAEVARPAMAAARLLKNQGSDGADVGDEVEAAVDEVSSALARLLDPEEPAEPEEPEEHTEPKDGAEAPADGVETMEGTSDPLLAEFLEEATEHLSSAEEKLLDLAEAPGDGDALNSVFRSVHTVKGGAGILDLEPLLRFAHSAESMLDLAREGAIRLEGHPLDLCFEALDILSSILEGLASGAESFALPPRYGDALAQLDAIADVGDQAPGAEVEATPAPMPVPPGPPSEPQAAPSEPEAPPVAPPEAKPRRRTDAASVKVATQRLDSMVDLVGELVITTAMVQQGASESSGLGADLYRTISHLSKVTTELQHMAMSMRMVPLKQTFQRAARLVRDVASKCGKSIRFESAGEDTELDRNVVERLGDPLIHMLRNAVDHGVEDPDAREAAGKPRTGTIRLEAYHESGRVVIVLSDDGGGMNRDRILAKAVASGLLTESQAAAMPDSEVWHLIFHPGLSTAQTVSSVSGRGVGMDVVRKNIEALRGSIDIESEPGAGSRMVIRLPLTLAIIDAMVVHVCGRPYILPTLTIQSFLRPAPEDVQTVQGRGEILTIRDQVLPIYRLAELLGCDGEASDATEGLLALTSGDGHDYALLVDDLRGQQQVVIKSLGSKSKSSAGISGAAILGDGTVGLILDPVGLARVALSGRGRARRSPALASAMHAHADSDS
ncbi:MAG: chemotaxis protein CheA [Planctomycetota bacterium]